MLNEGVGPRVQRTDSRELCHMCHNQCVRPWERNDCPPAGSRAPPCTDARRSARCGRRRAKNLQTLCSTPAAEGGTDHDEVPGEKKAEKICLREMPSKNCDSWKAFPSRVCGKEPICGSFAILARNAKIGGAPTALLWTSDTHVFALLHALNHHHHLALLLEHRLPNYDLVGRACRPEQETDTRVPAQTA